MCLFSDLHEYFRGQIIELVGPEGLFEVGRASQERAHELPSASLVLNDVPWRNVLRFEVGVLEQSQKGESIEDERPNDSLAKRALLGFPPLDFPKERVVPKVLDEKAKSLQRTTKSLFSFEVDAYSEERK